jgi:hypothetical protein
LDRGITSEPKDCNSQSPWELPSTSLVKRFGEPSQAALTKVYSTRYVSPFVGHVRLFGWPEAVVVFAIRPSADFAYPFQGPQSTTLSHANQRVASITFTDGVLSFFASTEYSSSRTWLTHTMPTLLFRLGASSTSHLICLCCKRPSWMASMDAPYDHLSGTLVMIACMLHCTADKHIQLITASTQRLTFPARGRLLAC